MKHLFKPGIGWRIATCLAVAFPGLATAVTDAQLARIKHVVVIYGENRSFDNLYGLFPKAEGIKQAKPEHTLQTDRDGKPMAVLPPIWKGMSDAVSQEQTTGLPNAPFQIDDPKGFNQPLDVPTRDLVHRFYQHQMQLNEGRNDRFAAWSDAGGLVMGYYDGRKLPMWRWAEQFTVADHFFMAAFGGSFLNHQWLICACTPQYPDAGSSPAKDKIAVVSDDGKSLKVVEALGSALVDKPKYVRDGALTPDGYAVNTMQPPYQPSAVPPVEGGDVRLANPQDGQMLPPQQQATIGDRLTAKKVSWAWYAGGWLRSLADRSTIYGDQPPKFQAHHQPFNYYASYAPGTTAREEHLKDGEDFLKDIDAGKLPAVSFYKPQGELTQHPGYADVLSGDQHIADTVARLIRGPQWKDMLIVVTYDENGGFWDHVVPPKGDRWGPGSRIPAIIISPYARRNHVDSTPYDTTSILWFLTRRFDLEPLPGMIARQKALRENGLPEMGDLVSALSPENLGTRKGYGRDASRASASKPAKHGKTSKTSGKAKKSGKKKR
ncbi:phospholipase C [Chitinivorax tropicus]|uniref:Phospholipase C n=1 Tax=Chitinivorax tropicus TaxID=714531 RepID=A0A840MMZ8_9PROT|nr:acid phosphatase [Chitinivorax tropicus]MBB5018479.1 phospholipase C [Chitinivorax tropicus]